MAPRRGAWPQGSPGQARIGRGLRCMTPAACPARFRGWVGPIGPGAAGAGLALASKGAAQKMGLLATKGAIGSARGQSNTVCCSASVKWTTQRMT